MNQRLSGVWRAVLWWVMGMASASLVWWGIGGREPAVGVVDSKILTNADTALPAQPTLSPDAAGAEPECFLGVVLAPAAVEVATEVGGRLESIRVRVGDAVESGDVLATLDRRTLEHQRSVELAALRNAEAQHRRRALEAERAAEADRRRQGLADLVSKEQQEASRFDSEVASVALAAAGAEVEQAQAKIGQIEAQLEKARIVAPFAGKVAHRYVDAGTVAAAGTPVLRLISGETLRTRFAVPPSDASIFAEGQSVRIEVEGQEAALSGIVEHLAPEIDAASQMIFAEARLSANSMTGAVASGAVARVSLMPPETHPRVSRASCFGPTRSTRRTSS